MVYHVSKPQVSVKRADGISASMTSVTNLSSGGAARALLAPPIAGSTPAAETQAAKAKRRVVARFMSAPSRMTLGGSSAEVDWTMRRSRRAQRLGLPITITVL